ncbi:MAG: hypothetical protein H8E78_10070, partial [Proteobacteria bacterium]|nr:hypothetical protein [Pseudomonadota bacterium]
MPTTFSFVHRGIVASTLFTLLVCGAAVSRAAEVEDERPTIQIGWTKTAPTIDGHFSPDEWADAAHIDGLTQATPDQGETATQRTEVWVMTDGDHLYVAARLG